MTLKSLDKDKKKLTDFILTFAMRTFHMHSFYKQRGKFLKKLWWGIKKLFGFTN